MDVVSLYLCVSPLVPSSAFSKLIGHYSDFPSTMNQSDFHNPFSTSSPLRVGSHLPFLWRIVDLPRSRRDAFVSMPWSVTPMESCQSGHLSCDFQDVAFPVLTPGQPPSRDVFGALIPSLALWPEHSLIPASQDSLPPPARNSVWGELALLFPLRIYTATPCVSSLGTR